MKLLLHEVQKINSYRLFIVSRQTRREPGMVVQNSKPSYWEFKFILDYIPSSDMAT